MAMFKPLRSSASSIAFVGGLKWMLISQLAHSNALYVSSLEPVDRLIQQRAWQTSNFPETSVSVDAHLESRLWRTSDGEVSRPLTGAEAVQAIDWDAVKAGYPIPRSMPTAASDDPVEAGFAPQWAERAFPPRAGGLRDLVLAIVSTKKMANDNWAYGVESHVRDLIRSGITPPDVVSRVFCNSVGCLCYFERNAWPLPDDVIKQRIITSAWATKFGIRSADIDATATLTPMGAEGMYWSLITIKRPDGR